MSIGTEAFGKQLNLACSFDLLFKGVALQRSAELPSRTWVFSGWMSVCLKKLFYIKEW